jgi:hypothetical protein
MNASFGIPGLLAGMRVVESPLAETVKVWHTAERHPRWKRRRQWRVVRHERREPAAYRLDDGTVIVHPAIAAQLRRLST